jgi:tetratricopeptide (TPR) repeat protein
LAGLLASVASLNGGTQTIPSEWEDRLYEQLKHVLGEWATTMNRRKLLRLLGWAAATVAASPMLSLDNDDQERLRKAIAVPSRVDGRVIDNIEALFRHCKRQEDALGSRIVLDTVLAQRGIIHDLLKDCPDELRPRLLSVYSDMSTSIGYYFFDRNDLNSARYYCDQARVAAHDADNTELGIYALCEMSYFASWQGKAPTAIDLAVSAESLLHKTDDPLMRVGVAQRSATAYAIDSQHKTCMAKLEQAQAALLSAGHVSVESPLYFYNEGYLASHKSECLLRLGKPQEAAVGASAGLTLYDQSFVDGYAVCTLHLGTAYLQAGEIDEAAQVIGSAAALSAQTHSARLMKELCTTRVRMESWKDTQAVRELDERLVGMVLG